MSINALSFRHEPDLKEKSNREIVALLPVWAFECEAHEPHDTDLDAYEDAVLRLIRLGLGAKAIASTLNATPSFIGTIMSNLQENNMIEKKENQGWTITQNAQAYFDGKKDETISDNSEYGYMFVSALKKDVLPYFVRGSIGNIKMLGGGLTISRKEENDSLCTFIPHDKIFEKAFTNYKKVAKYYDLQQTQTISYEEAAQVVEDLFGDLDYFDEAEDETVLSEEKVSTPIKPGDLSNKTKIRRLHTKPVRYYLRLRIVFDPATLNGYRVMSPFDMKGIDDPWYLRQIQWMVNTEGVLIGDESIAEFLERESIQLGSMVPVKEKDATVYLQEHLPRLLLYKKRLPELYANFSDIYRLIQTADSLVEKENVVNQLCTKLVEPLYRRFFQTLSDHDLRAIKINASQDLRIIQIKDYCERLDDMCHLDKGRVSVVSSPVRKAIDNLVRTQGNSILEKMLNLMIIYSYSPSAKIRHYIELDDFKQHFEAVCTMNRIRILVAHNARNPFTDRSYDEFMSNVFVVVDRMLNALIGG